MDHLNINSLRNRFELIKEVSFNNINMFFLGEVKLDETFPSNQFKIEGYDIFKLNRNVMGEVFVCKSTKI